MFRVALLSLVALVLCTDPSWRWTIPVPAGCRSPRPPRSGRIPPWNRPVFYNAQKFVVEEQEDGTYKVADRTAHDLLRRQRRERRAWTWRSPPRVKTKFKIQEDNDQCTITEHSVAYNDTAVADAEVAEEGGRPSVTCSGSSPTPKGNEVQRQEGHQHLLLSHLRSSPVSTTWATAA